MKQIFKRKAILPVLMLATGCLMAFTTLLQMSMGSPTALINAVASILFLVNAIWSFSTPIVTIDDSTIYFKEALLKQREIAIVNIEKVDMSDKRHIDIYRSNDSKVRIRFSSLSSFDKEEFIATMKDINNNYTSSPLIA